MVEFYSLRIRDNIVRILSDLANVGLRGVHGKEDQAGWRDPLQYVTELACACLPVNRAQERDTQGLVGIDRTPIGKR